MKETLETLKGKIAENTLTSEDIFAFTDKLRESMREGTPIVRNVSPVITSYSIHYTKLYESPDS